MPNAPTLASLLRGRSDEPTYRMSMLPFGTYANPDGSESLGFAVPGMVYEPLAALGRLAANSVDENGNIAIPNPENPQNRQDVLTGLLSLYGGNALNPAARVPEGALASNVIRKAPDRSLGLVSPKAEAIGTPSAPRSDVLAVNGATEADRIRAAEDAYVNAFRKDIEANKYRYFDDWRDDPNNPPVFDQHGNVVDIPQISDAFEAVSPYGYAPLTYAPPSAAAAGINAAARAVDRDLFLTQSSNSASHYGTLRTPSGKEYKVRVADHPNISSQFDPPDFNVAPEGGLTPEEFARLLPTLLSDTGKPSLLGSAIAGAEGPQRLYRGAPTPDGLFPTDRPLFMSSSPEVAGTYAGMFPNGPGVQLDDWTKPAVGSVAPMRVDFTNPMVVDAQGRAWNDIPFNGNWIDSNALTYWARDAGHDGLVIKNVADHLGTPDSVAPADTVVALKRGTVTSPLTGETLFSDQIPSLFGAPLSSSDQDAPSLSNLLRNRLLTY